VKQSRTAHNRPAWPVTSSFRQLLSLRNEGRVKQSRTVHDRIASGAIASLSSTTNFFLYSQNLSMKIHQYYVYILTNKSNTVLYVGVTSDLERRVWEHKEKVYAGFTSKYNVNKLVYYEDFQWIHDAIAREKQLKGGSRQKKIDLILIENPAWNDLSLGWYD